MTTKEIEDYVACLYARIGEAKILGRAEIVGGDWQPEPNKCHHNVSIWCSHNDNFSPVRGWLYFDLPGLPSVMFMAHSAVLTPEGELSDITPSNASRDYPFLSSNLSEEEYEKLTESIPEGTLSYVPKGA